MLENIKSIIILILSIVIVCLLLTVHNFKSKVNELQSKLNNQKDDKKNELVVNNTSATSAVYIDKANKQDNDVELSTKNNIRVKINGSSMMLPNNTVETNKFENGKLVLEQRNTSSIDLSNIVNDLAEAKGKQYSRSGKVDVGIIYNRKENELYGGMQYNTKAWNLGYYHSINQSNDLIMFNYKF